MLKTTLLLIFATILHQEVQGLECAIPNDSRTRIFPTIVEYQSNKISFSPLKPFWQGSNVEFSFLTINKLPKNVFVTFDSQFIIQLKLSSKGIKEVSEGAFYSLSCLEELLLDNNNITKLSRKVFQSLGKLKLLDLSHNKIEELGDLLFADLARLKVLILARNKIKKLEILPFHNLTVLEELDLDGNQIVRISPDLFQPLASLTNLSLSWNMLANIEPEKWGGLGELRFLDLAANNLNRFDPSYNFSFSSLKSLNLSFNSLTQFNVAEVRRHLPRLELVDLGGNPWFCDDLQPIIAELKSSNIKFISRNFSTVSIQGIACYEVPVYTKTSTSTEKAGTSTRNSTWVDKVELERYVEKKIEDNKSEVLDTISSLRSYVIFVFLLVCLFILFEICLRTNCCQFLLDKIKGGNETYFDNSSDVENFRLLRR